MLVSSNPNPNQGNPPFPFYIQNRYGEVGKEEKPYGDSHLVKMRIMKVYYEEKIEHVGRPCSLFITDCFLAVQ